MFDCMYTLFLPSLYTYLRLPYLLHSIDGVCVLWIDPALFLSPFSLEDKIIRKFSNGILIMKSFFVSRFAFRQNRVRKLVMDVFSIGAKMDLQISRIRMRIARERF